MLNQIKHLNSFFSFDFAWICKPDVIVCGDGQTATAAATTTTTTTYIVGTDDSNIKYKRAAT